MSASTRLRDRRVAHVVLARRRDATVADAAPEHRGVLLRLVDDAVVLVAPVPGGHDLRAQQRVERAAQPRPLLAEAREQLVMREQQHPAAVRVVLDDPVHPAGLLLVEVVVHVGGVEPDQQPVRVAEREVARGLAERGQDPREVAVAAGVHLVVAVERPVEPRRGRRPELEEPALGLPRRARVVDVAEVHGQVEAALGRDRRGAHGRPVEPRGPVREQRHVGVVGDRRAASSTTAAGSDGARSCRPSRTGSWPSRTGPRDLART